jgi:hypothetical protein
LGIVVWNFNWSGVWLKLDEEYWLSEGYAVLKYFCMSLSSRPLTAVGVVWIIAFTIPDKERQSLRSLILKALGAAALGAIPLDKA